MVSDSPHLATEQCPGCGSRVVFVGSGEDTETLCDPAPVSLLDPATVLSVDVSDSGAARAADVVVLPVHRCDPDSVVSDDLPHYDASVLAVSCPVRGCRGVSGRVCRSSRGALLDRPHGARIALSIRAAAR